MFRKQVEKGIKSVEHWAETYPQGEQDLEINRKCLLVIRELEQAAKAAGIPEAVAACQVRSVTIRKARQILAECLAACPEPKIKRVYNNQQEAADRLGVSRRTIKRLIDDDELDYTPVRGCYTFTEEQIQAYLAGEESETLFG